VGKAILKTLAYADIFDFPLKKDELWLWLIKGKRQKKERKSEAEFEQALEKLVKAGRCGQDSGFYFLPGRKKIINLRKKREKASKPKTAKAQKVTQILKLIPWIKLIGITGGLSRKNSEEKDDIDLFFITSKDRLWLSRGFVVLILNLLGLYRRPGKIKDMICPNMLVSEKALEMKPCDLFTAHETALMKPIFDRDRTYQRFLKANLWLKKFLPNWKP